MENKEQEKKDYQGENKKSNSRSGLFILIILLLMIGCGYLGWQLIEKQDTIEMITDQRKVLKSEKKAVEAELNDMLQEYNQLETENEDMQSKINAQQDKIKKLLKEAEKHKNDAYIIYKLKKEAGTLREIMKGYVHTIDSLNTLNVELRKEKETIQKELGQQKKKYTELDSVKKQLASKVEIGSRLNALDMIAYGQRVRRNGVHRETRRAGRAEKIKACFTIDENELTEAGQKILYLRIISPKGQVLQSEDGEKGKFEFNGVEGYYSVKKEVIYDNQELDVCMYWDLPEGEEMPEGEYIVEAYSDGTDIGKTTFELK